MELLPQQEEERKKILESMEMEEIQLLHQLFDNLILRSKSLAGIDRDVFVKYCPIPGLWGHRIYRYIKNYNKSEDDFINF
jgi:hypothetical protein